VEGCRSMLQKWVKRIFFHDNGQQSGVSCRLHFHRRNRRRLLWTRIVSRTS